MALAHSQVWPFSASLVGAEEGGSVADMKCWNNSRTTTERNPQTLWLKRFLCMSLWSHSATMSQSGQFIVCRGGNQSFAAFYLMTPDKSCSVFCSPPVHQLLSREVAEVSSREGKGQTQIQIYQVMFVVFLPLSILQYITLGSTRYRIAMMRYVCLSLFPTIVSKSDF